MSPFGSATLVLQGPGGKLKFEITGEHTTVGRTRDNEIVLQDPAVSSHHCELVADRTGLSLRDLNSSNGSYVNGRRVQVGPVFDGDTLKLGQFQGRIAVRNLQGKPLKAPGVTSPALVVGLVVLLVLAGAAGAGFVVLSRKAAAKRAYDHDYYPKATAYLAVEPCSAAQEGAARLRALSTLAGAPDLGRRGRLSRSQKREDARVLATSRKREAVVAQLVEAVSVKVAQEQQGLDELEKLGARLPDPELQAGAAGLSTLFAERVQAGHAFADGWKQFGAQLKDYDKLLARLAKGQDQDAADQLDGWKFKADPQALFEGCRTQFGQSQNDGLEKLAAMAPD